MTQLELALTLVGALGWLGAYVWSRHARDFRAERDEALAQLIEALDEISEIEVWYEGEDV